MNRLWWTLFSGLILLACTPPAPTPAPPSPMPPPVVRLARVADVLPLDDLLRTCAQRVNLLLAMEDLPYPPHRPQANIWLTWGVQPWDARSSSFLLDRWRAVPVVHRQVRVQQLGVEDVQRIYRGEVHTWEQLGGRALPLVPLVPPPGHPVFETLRSLVEPRGWAPQAMWTPEPRTALAWVMEHPGHLGWIPEAWLDRLPPQLVPLRLVGSLSFGPWPVLVQLRAEPAAWPEAEAWLRCLTGRVDARSAQEEVFP